MKLKRQSIDIPLEGDEGEEPGLIRFRRLPQNVIYARREAAEQMEKQRELMLKKHNLTDEAFREAVKEADATKEQLPDGLMKSFLDLLRNSQAANDAYDRAIFGSCYSVSGLEFDGHPVTVEDIKCCRIPAEVAEAILIAHREQLSKLLNPEVPEAEAKNVSSLPEPGSA
jgi:hypothetical protein